jgi:membrane protein implicated in regulation of membrane protease activity
VTAAVFLVATALLMLGQAAATLTTQPGGSPAPGTTNWTAIGAIAAALISATVALLIFAWSRRRNKVDILNTQQQMLERHIKIAEDLEKRDQRLKDRERELEDKARALNEWQASLGGKFPAGDDSPSVVLDVQEELRKRKERRREGNGNGKVP